MSDVIRIGLCALALATPLLAREEAESPAEKNQRAIALLDERDYDQAIRLFQEAAKESGNEPVIVKNLAIARNNRGVDHLNAGRLDAAITDLDAAVRLDPQSAGLLKNLGSAYLRQRDFGRAEGNLIAAQELDAADAKIPLLLGQLYYMQDDLHKAVACLELAAVLDPAHTGAKGLLDKAARELAVSADFVDRSSNDFTLKFLGTGNHAAVADEVLRVLDAARARVGSDLAHFPDKQTVVLLYDDGDFRRATGAHEWVGGLYDGKIRLNVQDFPREKAALERTARHEYTHRVLADLAPSCPIWANEGLAQWFEDEGAGAHEAVRELVAQGRKIPRFADLPATFAEQEDVATVQVQYAASYSFMTFLRDRYGVGSLRSFLVDLGRGRELDDAMERAFGRDLAALDDLWRGEILQ
jgi:tetratricopeptide (TPR) repeat protein